MTRRKKIALAAAVLGLSLIGLGLFLLFEKSAGPPSGYDGIAPGMTPQQVRALLGVGPAVTSEDGDSRCEIYYLSEMGSSWGQVHVAYREGQVKDKGFVPPEDLTSRVWEWIERLW
jgi:hypothetical protein